VTSPPQVNVFRGRPLLAATLIVVDQSGSEPRVLMGRRRPDAVFLPGKFVFPGGRLEDEDGDCQPSGSLDPHERDCLLRGGRHADPDRGIRAFVTAAIRETFEETGYLVSVDGLSNTGDRAADWSSLVRSGVRPGLGQLRYIARAITPPGRPRRYDTRFFLADAAAVKAIIPRTDGELSEIGWFGLDTVTAHDLPSITRLVLSDLRSALDRRDKPEIPFYFWRGGHFRRAVLFGRGRSA
jgi:8-oxo-dGTP pyrophosphatase MutT (NUDIX family)